MEAAIFAYLYEWSDTVAQIYVIGTKVEKEY
jgi:hypothetical protein